MKFKAVLVVAAAAAMTCAAMGSAAAQPLGPANAHRPASTPQVNGTQLATALLPPSAFGDGFTFSVALNTGSRLQTTRAKYHLPSLGCSAFEAKVYVAFFGNTAGASMGYSNPGWRSSFPNTIFGGDEDVQQFATAAAASTYYSQAKAKFAACRSFAENLSGTVFNVDVLSLTKTIVGGNQAFVVIELATPAQASGVLRYIAYLYVVAGPDVYHLDQGSGVNDRPSAALMLRLIHRVQALYPHH